MDIHDTYHKRNVVCSAMLIYHNGKGHAGITLTPEMNIIYHTGHFFERYNERLNLGLKTIPDIIRAYMSESSRYEFKDIEDVSPGIYKVFCSISSGIVLGTLNKSLRLMKANTFIPNAMLSKNQHEIKNQCIDVLEKYKYTSGLLN